MQPQSLSRRPESRNPHTEGVGLRGRTKLLSSFRDSPSKSASRVRVVQNPIKLKVWESGCLNPRP